MKTWGVVCALLSGAILAAMLASIHSCTDTYQLSAEGQLFRTSDPPSPGAPKVRGAACRWDEAFPLFPLLEHWTRPGDRLEKTRTTGGLWLFEVQMEKVEVFRGEESCLVAREGHFRFWAMILGASLGPMIAWGIAALWIANFSPPRPEPNGD
jgi:hypothetical protein